MASMISIGVSFLLFLITLGFMWMIGIHLISQLFESTDELTDKMVEQGGDPQWRETRNVLKEEIQLIMIWAPAILVLFASIKMLANAGGQGRD